MIISLLIIAVALLALVKAADWLVLGASSIASRLGVAPLVIGLTVVAFGTSAPELAVNLASAVSGATDIAVANVLGSNIANILLILGVVAAMKGIRVQRSTVWKEIPFMLLAAVVLLACASDVLLDGAASNVVTRTDGFALLGFFLIFLYYTYLISKQGVEDAPEVVKMKLPYAIGLIIVGLVGLVAGGHFLVEAAVSIARELGVAERIIGLTIVAVGTSLPEFVTSVVAARKGHADIAVGNIVGSNIFNIFLILGISSSIAPLPFSSGSAIDAIVVIASTLLLFLCMFVGKRHAIDRWQGFAMIGCYVAYVVVMATM